MFPSANPKIRNNYQRSAIDCARRERSQLLWLEEDGHHGQDQAKAESLRRVILFLQDYEQVYQGQSILGCAVS